jgi:hypothetical protein
MSSIRCVSTIALLAFASGVSSADSTAEKAVPKDRARVYITVSQSWAIGGWSPWWGLAGGVGGGARPQTAEITKSFAKNCPEVVPTLDRAQADFVLIVEHEGGKGVLRKDTKYAVYDASGDHLASGSVRMVGTAVRKACQAITQAAKPSAQPDTTASSGEE